MNRFALFLILVFPWILPGCGSESPAAPKGWYFAGSNLKDENAIGGFGPCNNFPKKCENDGPGKAGDLSLIAFPEEVVELRNRKAILLRLVNRTERTMAFSACDSGLYIVQEALDGNENWKPLERFPDSSCGNSFHRVFLESQEYWEFFAVPREGKFKTKLRFRLEPEGEDGIGSNRGTLFSNEYEGSIDPRAFIREESPE